jgi:hypothetical protein
MKSGSTKMVASRIKSVSSTLIKSISGNIPTPALGSLSDTKI